MPSFEHRGLGGLLKVCRYVGVCVCVCVCVWTGSGKEWNSVHHSNYDAQIRPQLGCCVVELCCSGHGPHTLSIQLCNRLPADIERI